MNGPCMTRARTQLATTYAPGSYFTFEGGRGCFIATPSGLDLASADNNPAIKRQIEELMREYINNWHLRGMTCRSTEPRPVPVHPEQTLDASLLLNGVPDVHIEAFHLVTPSKIGYAPSPLNFYCSVCGLLHNYDGVDDLARKRTEQEARTDCRDRNKHAWRQLDVFFHHWSGSVEPLHPRGACGCGGTQYRLHKALTGVFSDWKFQCTNCGDFKNLFLTDPMSTGIFNRYPDVQHFIDERTMLPISYRSSAVFYPQSERFIPHNDPELVSLLEAGRELELGQRLMKMYGYTGHEISLDELRQLCQAAGPEKMRLFAVYEDMAARLGVARANDDNVVITLYEDLVARTLQGILPQQEEDAPVELLGQCRARHGYIRRYDPIRLGLEHDSMTKKYLAEESRGSHADLLNPPADIRPAWARDNEGLVRYRQEMGTACSILGVERIHLVRKLDIIQYSFGYSRVSHGPVHDCKGMSMPVRLNLFPHVARNRRPIYTLQQQNEGIYVRLKQDDVARWLEANNVSVEPALAAGQKLGARYIEQYEDFGYYLQEYRRKRSAPRSVPNLVFTLLHTMAHQLMHVIAEFSGLELGSMGECIYPADLSFIVYRSALTPDLRNISSMWRNFGAAVLRQMYDQQYLQCESGSLCDQRGSACPGCIMIPEVTCIAWNDLLSRSALGGGTTPEWDDATDRRMVGFLEVTTGRI